MSDSQILRFENRLSLYFSDQTGLTLTKVVYVSGSTDRPCISLLNDGSVNLEAYSKFDDSLVMKAFGILILRACLWKLSGSNTFPSLTGNISSPAEKLVEELLTEENQVDRLLYANASNEDKKFHHIKSGEIFVVIPSERFLNTTEMNVMLNERPLNSASEIYMLEERIAAGIKNQNDSLDFKLHSLGVFPDVAMKEMKHTITAEVSPKILNLFSKKLEERLIKNGISAVQARLEELSKRELPYHLSQHTKIDFLPNFQWKISFEFELINSGFLPIYKRTHQYWFELPQGDVNFEAIDEFGKRIQYSLVKSSEKYREIVIELPKPLNALEKLKYTITYVIQGLEGHGKFCNNDGIYYLSPRTLTKKLALTIRRYDGSFFVNPRVAVETEGGFHKDDVPELTVTNENGIEVLHWIQNSPKPGELFRTLWSNYDPAWDQTQSSKEKKDNIISFPDRNRTLDH